MDVQKFLDVKGPKGTYSQACISRADPESNILVHYSGEDGGCNYSLISVKCLLSEKSSSHMKST
jgi:hypothetical protein